MQYLTENRRRKLVNAATAGLILIAATLAIIAAILAVRASSNDAVRYGAAAAGLSVVVIGLQAWETRRASEAADRALQHAQASIAVSERTALEAARTRLDARAPTIHVTVGKPEWPPKRPPQFQGGEPGAVGLDEQLYLPRDEQMQILVTVDGVIRNESAITVELSTNNLSFSRYVAADDGSSRLVWDYPATYQRHLLDSGKQLEFRLHEARPVSAWVQNAEASTEGVTPPQVIVGEVIFSDPFDNGIVDNWRVELTGQPLEHVSDVQGGVRVPRVLVGDAPMVATIRPVVRRYYHSKSNNEEFPSA